MCVSCLVDPWTWHLSRYSTADDFVEYVYLYEHDALYKVVPVTSRLH
jgi:hypothetical protein